MDKKGKYLFKPIRNERGRCRERCRQRDKTWHVIVWQAHRLTLILGTTWTFGVAGRDDRYLTGHGRIDKVKDTNRRGWWGGGGREETIETREKPKTNWTNAQEGSDKTTTTTVWVSHSNIIKSKFGDSLCKLLGYCLCLLLFIQMFFCVSIVCVAKKESATAGKGAGPRRFLFYLLPIYDATACGTRLQTDREWTTLKVVEFFSFLISSSLTLKPETRKKRKK